MVSYSQDLGFDQYTVRKLENVNWIWDLTADGEAEFAKIGYGCGIGKENNIRHSNDRSLGCRILMEIERECGIRIPSSEPSGCHLA